MLRHAKDYFTESGEGKKDIMRCIIARVKDYNASFVVVYVLSINLKIFILMLLYSCFEQIQSDHLINISRTIFNITNILYLNICLSELVNNNASESNTK